MNLSPNFKQQYSKVASFHLGVPASNAGWTGWRELVRFAQFYWFCNDTLSAVPCGCPAWWSWKLEYALLLCRTFHKSSYTNSFHTKVVVFCPSDLCQSLARTCHIGLPSFPNSILRSIKIKKQRGHKPPLFRCKKETNQNDRPKKRNKAKAYTILIPITIFKSTAPIPVELDTLLYSQCFFGSTRK